MDVCLYNFYSIDLCCRCGLKVEEVSDGDGKSKSNYHEAELCVALCRYFVKQGYYASSITILVAYTGQILTVKKLLMADKNFYSGKCLVIYASCTSNKIFIIMDRSMTYIT